MKELSIEEKAKAYDKALEIARQIQNEQKAQCANVMLKVFPELAESEDERIRKVLINMFKGYDIQKVGDFTDKEIIAWLEKQGGQKPAWSEGDETGWTNTMIMIKECATNHYTKDSINLVLNWLKSLKERVQPQPKQEWGEEDKHEIQHIIDFLNHPDLIKATPTIADNCKNWLKSLKATISARME